jgi:hypothetical protein
MSTDIDELLQEHAGQWAARQSPPPDLQIALDRLHARRRAPGYRWAVAASVIIIAVVGAALIARSSSPSARVPVKAVSTTSPDPLRRELSKIARQVAIANGDPHAKAQAVLTTYLAAENAVEGGDRSYGTPDDAAVWVIQLRGNFVCRMCSSLVARPPLRGHTITMILDANTFGGHDFGFGGPAYDLSRLGNVIELNNES